MKSVPKLSSLIDKAVFDYNLIEPGDKILVGASGGKDSTALIEYFANRKKRPDADFEYKAVNIQSDFAPPLPSQILKLFDKWNVPFETLKVDILQRLKPDFKMSCYWCSTQRRTELINFAIQNRFNKIALGHHMDDILETFIMNMLNKGELSSMTPKLKYDNYSITIIRPLCYILEERLIAHAVKSGYSGFTCTCNYQENSGRKEARKKLEQLTESDSKTKQRLFDAMKNVQKEYLP